MLRQGAVNQNAVPDEEGGAQIYLFQADSGAYPALYPISTGGSFPLGKPAEA
jgi:hypothetical protein